MTIREIIISHLKSISADGLCQADCHGCGIDDLFPRSCPNDCVWECVPAERVTATEAGESHEIGDDIYEEIK